MTRRSRGVVCAITATVAAIVALEPTSASTPARAQGSLSGTVITTSTPAAPLARVLVTITGQSLTASRTVVSDDLGRFDFQNLPSGVFTIVAMRPPYVTTAFGAKRPGRPGTPISLAAGQQMTGITIPLAFGAAITGTIRDADGEAAPGVKVEAMPLDVQADPLRAPIVTDDRGVYRIFGLAPGKYVVTAKVSDFASTIASTSLTQFSDAEMDDLLARLQRRSAGLPAAPSMSPARSDAPKHPATYGYAPIYYPGTPDPDQAAPINLAAGDDRGGIDIGLQLVRTSAIEGRVSFRNGPVPSGTYVTLTRDTVSIGSPLISPTAPQYPDAAGDFRFKGVLPGRYRVVARAATTTPGVFWALADVNIGEDDVSGLTLTLQPGLRLSGRIAFDAHTSRPPADLTAIRLRPVDVNPSQAPAASGVGRSNGTFQIDGLLPGSYSMTAMAPSGWSLRSVIVDGRDMLDFPLELGPAGDVGGVIATFTDQPTELSGTLQTAASVAAPDYFVVVFSRDRAFWRPGTRRIQFTRPGTDGRFTFRDLPAGDYLIAALTDMESSDLRDTSFIEQLVAAAVPLHLNDGEQKTQDLKLVK